VNKFVLLFYLLIAQLSFAQNATYYSLVNKADSLYKKKEFKKSAFTYSEAFKTLGWKGLSNDRYNAACVWSLAGYPDSAFFNLEKIAIKIYYSDLNQITSESAFNSLHSDKRWKPLMEIIKANQARGNIDPNLSLTKQLEIIYYDDQKYRKMLDSIGKDEAQRQEVYRMMGECDHYNLMKVKNILDRYGWLGADSVGFEGNEALFLVIQHSDLTTQEKYFPMLSEAVKNGKLRKSSFALFEDRINLRQGKKQNYGSQIGYDERTNLYYVLPLEDPENVDKRRAEVGLQPLAEYVMQWNINWDVEQYKKDLPNLESLEK
jgi:hypothetical protein